MGEWGEREGGEKTGEEGKGEGRGGSQRRGEGKGGRAEERGREACGHRHGSWGWLWATVSLQRQPFGSEVGSGKKFCFLFLFLKSTVNTVDLAEFFQNELCLYAYISFEVIQTYLKYLLKEKWVWLSKPYFRFRLPNSRHLENNWKYFCSWKKLFRAPRRYLTHPLKMHHRPAATQRRSSRCWKSALGRQEVIIELKPDRWKSSEVMHMHEIM